MATLLSTFREPVRVLIGDNDPDIQLREDAQIDAGMRTVVNLCKVTGDQTTVDFYTLDEAQTSITPSLTPAGDPKAWAQLVLHTAKMFVADVNPTSWGTRAFRETIGNNDDRIFHLLEDIYRVEFGEAMESSDYDTD